MLNNLDAAISGIHVSFEWNPPAIFEELAKIKKFNEAVERLLEALEENAAGLPNDPRLRAAVREVCDLGGWNGPLAVMV